MRKRNAHLIFPLLVWASCFGQHANVSVKADAGIPHDARPFGKYLVEICTISGDNRTLTCHELPLPHDAVMPGPSWPPLNAVSQQKDQAIAISLVCDPALKASCDPPSPKIGEYFFVSATADSGLPVQQRVLSGSVTPLGGAGTVQYRTNGPGPIIIRASGTATTLYTAPAPIDLVLQTSSDSGSASDSCPVLPPSSGTQSTLIDAPTIVSLMGNPTPFILAAQGPNSIAIYSTRQPLKSNEHVILLSFQKTIAELAGRTIASLGITMPGKAFSVELKIPHASALGDLGTRIGGLNYSQFTVQDVGRGWVRVTAATQPDCATWKGFLTDIREMAWQLVSQPMNKKLFYLSSSDVATAFSGLSPAVGATPSASSTPATASGSSSATSPASASSTSAASPNAVIAITQPPGSNIQINSDTTPCVVAGLALGNTTGCGPAPVATPGATSASPSPPASPAVPGSSSAPLAMGSMAVAAGTGEQTPPDLLVYSDSNPGDDAQIDERNRIIAQLDLPRPEMILSAWVTQDSSASPQAIGAFNNMVKGLVADYDHEFESLVLKGWESVKGQSADPSYFNEPFRSYIADRFVADTSQERKAGSNVRDLSQTFLDTSQVTMADPIYPMKRTNLGICERGRYCLGYTGLFNPLKPAFTDLLLTVVAAEEPVAVADEMIRKIEGPALPADTNVCEATGASPSGNDRTEVRNRCRAIRRNLDLEHVSPRLSRLVARRRIFGES